MRRRIVSIACAALLFSAAFGQAGNVDPGFLSGTGGNNAVSTSVIQPDGKIIIGGSFTDYNGTARDHIARIAVDGTLDATFDPGSGANGIINAAVLQVDGKILIGGDFTSYNGTARDRMARLNADGSLDNTFNPGAGADVSVAAIALQSDGKVVIGGGFTSFNGTARNGIARLNADGSLDASFNPVTASGTYIHALVAQADGKIVIGGDFTSGGAIPSNYITRLNGDGTVDSNFEPGSGTNYLIFAMVQQTDGKIIIGGQFGNFNGVFRPYIARILPNGNLDPRFDPGGGPDQLVTSLALQADGKILVGGDFTSYDGAPVDKIIRLIPNGSLDATFNTGTGANGAVNTIAVQTDGKLIIGGAFTTYNGTASGHIARLRVYAAVDPIFNSGSGANGAVLDSKTVGAAGDKVIIVGAFTQYNGVTVNHIARLNRDGSLDPTFLTGYGANDTIFTIDTLRSGDIMIGGKFSIFDGNVTGPLVRLDCNGVLDPSFSSYASGQSSVYTIVILNPPAVVQAPPVIITAPTVISGTITVTSWSPTGVTTSVGTGIAVGTGTTISTMSAGTHEGTLVLASASETHPPLVVSGCVLPDSLGGCPSTNPGFTPVTTGSGAQGSSTLLSTKIAKMSPYAVLFNLGDRPGSSSDRDILSDGKLLLVGNFTSFNNAPRSGIVRLDADGEVDLTFDPGTGANGPINTFTEQPDGKIVIGGEFTSFNGVERNRIARLNQDGSVDLTFDPGAGSDGTIHTISLFGADNTDTTAPCGNYNPEAGSPVDVFVGGEQTSLDSTLANGVGVVGQRQDDDCLGVPGGSALPGSSCDDGDASTGNDVYGSDCVCLGQALDCEGVPGGTATVGTACDDGDANTENDAYDANCNCVGETLDCEGVLGGSATVGSSCDDGDANTVNDVYDASCVCAGVLAPDFSVSCFYSGCDNTHFTGCHDDVATLNVNAINGFNEAITVSFSGAPSWLTYSTNSYPIAPPYPDVMNHIRANAASGYVPGSYTYDIVLTSVPSGITHSFTTTTTFMPQVPVTCGGPYGPLSTTDSPITLNGSPSGYWDGDGVSGDTFDPATAGAGTHTLTFQAIDPEACDASCSTMITVNAPPAPDCEGVPGGPATVGTSCDDGDANTGNDVYDANCNCIGQALDCEGVAGGTATVGTSCDDGNANTGNDVYDANCNCAGTSTGSCTGNEVVVAITTDDFPQDITWEITDASAAVITSGGTTFGQGNMVVTETACLGSSPASASYGFKLMDEWGDGITNGGWELRTTDGKVLLRDDFANGSRSPSATPANASYTQHSFSLPAGNAKIAAKSCGVFNSSMNNLVYSNTVPGATSYQFEFSNPDAGFIRRIAVATPQVRYNQMVTSPLTPGVKYFARVRTNATGAIADAHFGAGCELGMVSTIPCTELISAPTYGHSCNEERSFNTNNSFIYADPVVGATEYQFRLTIPSEGYDETFIRSTYILQLKWNSSVAPPLVNGSTYNVQVNVKVGATYSGFCGDVCTITINNSTGAAMRMEQANGNATLWPNPVHESQVNLSIDGIQDADQQITVDIQDIYGKQVFAKAFGNSGERFSTVLDLPSDIASGVYIVNLTVNGRSAVQRLSIIK